MGEKGAKAISFYHPNAPFLVVDFLLGEEFAFRRGESTELNLFGLKVQVASIDKLSSNSVKSESWGTPESYWPFPRYTSPLSKEDLEHSRTLTPSQRVEWAVMMHRLLTVQFKERKPAGG